MSEEKVRVRARAWSRNCTALKSFSSPARRVSDVVDEFFCSEVEIVGSEIRCRPLCHGRFLFWRQPGLKLVGDFFGNLALNAEDIGQVAVIFLGPNMRVIAGID